MRTSDDTSVIGAPNPLPATRLHAGANLGRYAILRELGFGGMGVVYVALDPDLDRQVAIKLVRADRDDSNAQARLLREAQAMARLDHRNLVPVFELGRFTDGVFIVMPYVEGLNLAEWLDASPRSWREIVRMFIAAGRGLAAAHEAGIVHRDFKPRNVLVSRDGAVLVTDFGLACSSESEEPVVESPLMFRATMTAPGTIVGTPSYMAPEQWRGESVDARADQFSFAVAVYKAVYGVHPLDEPLAEAQTIDGPGPNPGANTRAARSERGAPRALRRILQRALAADPRERFPNMDELLEAMEDLLRRRRRRLALALGMAASMVLLLAAGSKTETDAPTPCEAGHEQISSAWSWWAELRVEGELGTRFGPHATRPWETVRRLFQHRASQWVEEYEEACRATHVRGDQSPLVLDAKMRCLADRKLELAAAVSKVGNARTQEQLERSVRSAMELEPATLCRDAILLSRQPPLPKNPATRARIDAQSRYLAHLDTQMSESLSQLSSRLPEIRDLGYAPLTASALAALASVQRGLADLKAAERTLTELVDVTSRSDQPEREALAWIEMLWVVGYGQGRYREIPIMMKAARSAIARAGDRVDLSWRLDLSLAGIAQIAGRHRKALTLASRVVEAVRRDPSATRWLLEALESQANALRVLGHTDRAIAVGLEVLTLRQRALGANSSWAAHAHSNLAGSFLAVGRLSEARRHAELAHEIWRKIYGSHHPFTGQGHCSRGSVYAAQGQLADAHRHLSRCLVVFEAALGPNHYRVRTPMIALAKVEQRRGDVAAAERRLTDLVQRLESVETPRPSDARAMYELARLYIDLGQRRRAIPLLRRALVVAKKQVPAQYRALMENALRGQMAGRGARSVP